jgi:AGZA family xanthine/uracil permease-like MFS transporter
VTAPAIIVVGSLMAAAMRKVQWNEPSEGIPAFLTMIAMPLTFSIADGLAIGFIAASVVDLCRSDGRRLPIGIHAVAVLLVLRYAFL